jgi:hypothetical protein
MTGSGINKDQSNVLPGAPIAEDQNGNVSLAIDGSPIAAFAVAIDGTPPGGIVTYATDGTVERSDWFLITGSKLLSPGKAYYLSGVGKLTTSGVQQIGVARSTTVLRIQVLQPIPKVSQIWPLTSPPYANLGKEGDLAYDARMKQLYGPKTSYGWGRPAWLIQDVGNWKGPVTLANVGGIWHPTVT